MHPSFYLYRIVSLDSGSIVVKVFTCMERDLLNLHITSNYGLVFFHNMWCFVFIYTLTVFIWNIKGTLSEWYHPHISKYLCYNFDT